MKKSRKQTRNICIFLSIISIILTIVFFVYLINLNMIPNKYLIMLGVAIVCRFVMLIDTKVYINKYYAKIAKIPFLEKMSATIKNLFFTLLIFPYIFDFLIIVFLNEWFLEALEKALQNSEYYQKRVDK